MTWMQSATGRAISLPPVASDIDFAGDVAPALARIARYNGHVAAGPFSVAQHSIIGADALLAETGSPRLAALFILHDAHEWVLGDMITPVVQALSMRVAAVASWNYGEAPREDLFRTALRDLKKRTDAAIFAAAGIPQALPDEAVLIADMDIRMLRTERDHLLTRPPMAWHPAIEKAEPVRVKGRIRVLPWPEAADNWLRRLHQWCPLSR